MENSLIIISEGFILPSSLIVGLDLGYNQFKSCWFKDMANVHRVKPKKKLIVTAWNCQAYGERIVWETFLLTFTPNRIPVKHLLSNL